MSYTLSIIASCYFTIGLLIYSMTEGAEEVPHRERLKYSLLWPWLFIAFFGCFLYDCARSKGPMQIQNTNLRRVIELEDDQTCGIYCPGLGRIVENCGKDCKGCVCLRVEDLTDNNA